MNYYDKKWWHEWTAWYPVKVKNKWVWLRDIWRKANFYRNCVCYDYSLNDPRKK